MAVLSPRLYVLYEQVAETHKGTQGEGKTQEGHTEHHVETTSMQALPPQALPPQALPPQAIACGFSVAAFFFRGLWALWHRMWSVAITLFALSSGVQSVMLWLYQQGGGRSVLVWGSFLWIVYGLVVGLYGNMWRASFLYERGYKPVRCVHGGFFGVYGDAFGASSHTRP